MKFIRAALAVGLGAAVVLPLRAQQGDPSQQNAARPNAFATPSPTVSPDAGKNSEHRKHQRKHRGKRRQARTRDQHRAMTRQHGQARDRQQNGSGTEQRRPEETNVTPAATELDGKAAPEGVTPQHDAAAQPTPY